MSFSDKILEMANGLDSKIDNILTEEATKHSIIMPFIQALGYDIFDPTVVVPEFVADIGAKKGEKVDYAILKDGKPLILIEAKNIREQLDKHGIQLERYFGALPTAKFGILTNGLEYLFFSDLDSANMMDKRPFMVIDLQKLNSQDIKEFEKFAKDNLDLDTLIEVANKRKYITSVKTFIKEQLQSPQEEFVRFIGKQCSDKIMNAKKIEEFTGYIKTATNEVIGEIANQKLGIMQDNINSKQDEECELGDGIITTEEEINGFFIIKSILAEIIEDISIITYKDTLSYFGVIINNNSWKWICRLHFNTNQKKISIRIEDKKEQKLSIDNLGEIYKHRDQIKKAYHFANA